MYTHVRVYLLHAYMHGSRNFHHGGGGGGGWAVRAQLVEKSPDNFLVLNLFYSGCLMFISKNYNFPESKQGGGGGGGSTISGGPTFSKVMGPNCFFYRTCCFPGGSGLPVPSLWIRALPLCMCPCLWPFKVTKNEACSKFFKGIGVHGHLKEFVA